ncbi:hypothetical protein [Kitasatospora sp. NPDC004289]
MTRRQYLYAGEPVVARPYCRPHHPSYVEGDAEQPPPELMSGPGRSRHAQPRWRWVRIRIGGRWLPGRVDSWRLHEGSSGWVVSVRWGPDIMSWGWYWYDPAAIEPTPQPTDPGGPASW